MLNLINDSHKFLSHLYDKKKYPAPIGWTLWKAYYNPKTGFYAEAYIKEKTILYVVKGMEINDTGDWNNVIKILNNKAFEQLSDARKFYDEIVENNIDNFEIVLTGYSLGGCIVQILGTATGHITITFGAYGMESMLRKKDIKYTDNIYNYGKPNDPIFMANINNFIGNVYLIGKKIDLKNNQVINPRLRDLNLVNIKYHIPPYEYDTGTMIKYHSKKGTKRGSLGTAIKLEKKISEKYHHLLFEIIDKDYKAKNKKNQVLASMTEKAAKAKHSAKNSGQYLKSKSNTLPQEAKNTVASAKKEAQKSVYKAKVTVGEAVERILSTPAILHEISVEDAKKLVKAVKAQYSEDKELVQNISALVDDIIETNTSHTSKAIKAQRNIAKQLAQKTQKKVLQEAGFSKEYIEKHHKKIQSSLSSAAPKNNKLSEKELTERNTIEKLRPSLKLKRVLEESWEKKTSGKNLTEADKWFEKELSRVPDPTRPRPQSIDFENLRIETPQEQKANASKRKMDRKTGLMLLSLMLGSILSSQEKKYPRGKMPLPPEVINETETPSFDTTKLKERYVNKETGSKKIYTLEEVKSMPENEYKKHKKAILYQSSVMGIPTRKQAEKEVSKGGMVYVHAYTRDDGTHVDSYYRSRPA